jgi:hypothetical protein
VSATPEERIDLIVQGLIGDRLDLWNHDAEFHYAVKSLAGMMILVADLMADGEAPRAEERRKNVEAARRATRIRMHIDDPAVAGIARDWADREARRGTLDG